MTIEYLQRAAKAARLASMPIGGSRGVAIVLLDDGLMVRGWDTSQKDEVRASQIVTWQEFIRQPVILDNAIVLVTDTLDRTINR